MSALIGNYCNREWLRGHYIELIVQRENTILLLSRLGPSMIYLGNEDIDIAIEVY